MRSQLFDILLEIVVILLFRADELDHLLVKPISLLPDVVAEDVEFLLDFVCFLDEWFEILKEERAVDRLGDEVVEFSEEFPNIHAVLIIVFDSAMIIANTFSAGEFKFVWTLLTDAHLNESFTDISVYLTIKNIDLGCSLALVHFVIGKYLDRVKL